ncbi:bacillithiol biosynthesis cysteine-adding enzyme BshC [Tenacibaculum sp. E3R01]|uniref:bacillithiol biosynthesis cysteine-adding enzyme BshC n=1 Tax=Tenacibaculum sp. E3R01 TaxID=2267227 RepID=UPI000DE80579|nr:bacillithiol biosynthesis cysteine-adding enzyme BshC [Tenacibaculum sp. E3R01]RBW62997.1 bacillithiol biosynthesis cysteine-adding enzyme BshC [Tenacibaculum sp. E3R01]
MKTTQIPFKNTGFFSKTMIDYLEEDKQTKPFYGNFPSVKGLEKQLDVKKDSIKEKTRKALVNVLKKQYQKVKTSELTLNNIDKLQFGNTFTITTGHQLNLFTGPLYFLYKIISTINLCEELTSKFHGNNFVPVYWMATEDHDFEEINYFNFKGKKVRWNSDQTGGVGRFSTEGLDEVLNVFSNHLGNSKKAQYLKELFEEAYVNHSNLADATRYIANELFGEYGLVILDADERELKQEFIPYITKELKEQVSFRKVNETIKELGKNYKVQVNPREINLFYLTEGVRERIIFKNGVYTVNNTDISWDLDSLELHLKECPECFSPNVIMRPLYQEVILPNLCYIGGGGELAYWFQLKQYFEEVEVPFPILLLRNSVQVLSEKQVNKLEKLNVTIEELFVKQNELLKKKVTEKSDVSFDFDKQKEFLEKQFNDLRDIAKSTDVSFVGAVNAQEKKQLKGLVNLEKRLLRAEKRKQYDLVQRITELQSEILPNLSLEERQRNFSEYYLEYGNSFIKYLKENLHPLDLQFTVMTI